MGKGILTPISRTNTADCWRSELFTPAQEHGDRPAGRLSCQEILKKQCLENLINAFANAFYGRRHTHAAPLPPGRGEISAGSRAKRP
jgi:hypothetical protein